MMMTRMRHIKQIHEAVVQMLGNINEDNADLIRDDLDKFYKEQLETREEETSLIKKAMNCEDNSACRDNVMNFVNCVLKGREQENVTFSKLATKIRSLQTKDDQ